MAEREGKVIKCYGLIRDKTT